MKRLVLLSLAISMLLGTPMADASDLTSSSFIIRDPVIGVGGGYGTSASFGLYGSGDTITIGRGTSASFEGRAGFLWYPYVTQGAFSVIQNANDADLSWSAGTAGLGWSISGYRTGIATVSGGPYTYTAVGNVTSYSYTNLTPGQYCFVLQTLDAFSEVIATSSEQCITIHPTLTLSISDSAVGFGTLSVAGVRYATTTGGSGVDTTAHTMSVSSNASSGYTLTYKGASLSSGSGTVTPATSVSGNGTPGTAQFGLSLGTTGAAVIPSAYQQSGPTRSFVANTTTSIATTTAPSSVETFDVHYMANIAPTTPAGQYSTAITYIVTGNF